MTPEDMYAGLIVSHRRGSWRYCLVLAGLLRRWLAESAGPGKRGWERRVPTIVEIEAEARERLGETDGGCPDGL